MEQKQKERLDKAREEKERIQNLTKRGVPKPKNPTSLQQMEKSDDASGSLLGIGKMQDHSDIQEPE